MKKILTTALAIVLFVGASQAQDGGRRHGKDGEKFAQALQLTEDQKAKLKTIREAEKKEMDALRANEGITVADQKAQRKAIHDKYRSQFDAVLTPAQKAEMEKKKAEWKEKGKDGKGVGRRGGDTGRLNGFGQQGAFFKKELNLSADQETRLKGIFDEFQSKAQGIRSNTGLTDAQKKEQTQTLAKQYMTQGKAVLNAEQLKKLDEMKGKRKDKLNRNL